MKLAAIALTVASLSLASAPQASTLDPLVVSVERASPALLEDLIGQSGDLQLGSGWETGGGQFQLPSEDFPIVPTADNKLTDPCGNACSPFYFGVFGKLPDDLNAAGAPGWQTAQFWTVFAPDTGTNTATLNLGSVKTSFSLLWGSPDETNMLEFILDGAVKGSFRGSDFAGRGFDDIIRNPGQSAVLTSFSGLSFDSVRFSAQANGGSFEFSNITAQPAPVPLPAGVVLLLTGLVAVAGVRRRARR